MCKIEVLPDGDLLIKIPMSLRSVAGRKRIITPGAADQVGPQNKLMHPVLQTLARAFYWQKLLDEGQMESASAIAAAIGMDVSYVTRILRFTFISPKIVRMFINGTAPDKLTIVALRKPLPSSWAEQEAMLLGPTA